MLISIRLTLKDKYMHYAFSSAIAAAALLAPAFVLAADSDFPIRRPGLWDISNGGAMQTQSCVGTADEQRGKMLGLTGGCGSAPEIAHTADGFTIHAVCHPRPEITTDTFAAVSGDFNSAYTVKMEMHMNPAPPQIPGGVMNMTLTAKYAGACPPDMKPGDTKAAGRVIPSR